MTTAEVLKAARDLITPESAWTQGHLALDSYGKTTMPSSKEAVCWCAYGAIKRSMDTGYDKIGAFPALRRHTKSSITGFNDTHTHAEVLAAFDAAIAAQEAKECLFNPTTTA